MSIKIGSFELGNKVDITDPCYDKDAWCRITADCVPGTYTAYYDMKDCGEWGNRVAKIYIIRMTIRI